MFPSLGQLGIDDDLAVALSYSIMVFSEASLFMIRN